MRKTILYSLLILLASSDIALADGPCYWVGQVAKCFPSTGLYLDNQRSIRLGTNNTTNYVEIKAPSGMSGNVTFTMPSNNISGSLTNDGSGTLSWMAAGGGVTSVGLSLPSIFTVSGSPVTTTGTLTGTLATEVANTIFSGPTTGADAAPTFRALVTADLPTVPITKGGTGQTTANAGFNALSPMTTAGDIIYGGTVGAGTRLAIGSATTVLHGGTTAPAYAAVTLTTDVTGILPTANGGTGQNSSATFPTSGTIATTAGSQTLQNKTIDNTNNVTLTHNNFILQDNIDTTKQAKFSIVNVATATTRTITVPDASITLGNNPLTTNGDIIYGVGAVPTRLGIGAATAVLHGGASAPAYSQIVDADVSSSAAIAGSKLAAASASVAGAVTTGTQTLAGAKTFSSGIVIGGNTTGDSNLGTISSVTNSKYYVGSFTATFTQAGGYSQAVTVNYELNGQRVALFIPLFLGTSTATSIITAATAIPSGLRPTTVRSFIVQTHNGGTLSYGLMVLRTTGNIELSFSQTVANFTTALGNTGLDDNTDVFYQLN